MEQISPFFFLFIINIFYSGDIFTGVHTDSLCETIVSYQYKKDFFISTQKK